MTEKKPAAQTSKFSEFLASKKLDGRRIISASTGLERLQPEDRAIRLAQKLKKKGDGKKDEGGEKKKPRSGRPVTPRAMAAALTGGTISGPTKTRILRAVNHLLAQKKQDVVTLDVLF